MYKTSSELKQEARKTLEGRWKDAVLLNIVPSILSFLSYVFIVLISIAMVVLVFFLMNTSNTSSTSNNSVEQGIVNELDDDSSNDSDSSLWDSVTTQINVNPTSLIISIVLSFLSIGILFTFLDLIRDPSREIRPMADAFRIFNQVDFVPVLLIQILVSLFTFLWSLLFIIPGIIKKFSYSQAYFIYKDISQNNHMEKLSVTHYIGESKQLMRGHKGRLFGLYISFIGWFLLSLVTCGIALFWINPYLNATLAAFYNDLAKDKYLAIDNNTNDFEEWTDF